MSLASTTTWTDAIQGRCEDTATFFSKISQDDVEVLCWECSRANRLFFLGSWIFNSASRWRFSKPSRSACFHGLLHGASSHVECRLVKFIGRSSLPHPPFSLPSLVDTNTVKFLNIDIPSIVHDAMLFLDDGADLVKFPRISIVVGHASFNNYTSLTVFPVWHVTANVNLPLLVDGFSSCSPLGRVVHAHICPYLSIPSILSMFSRRP